MILSEATHYRLSAIGLNIIRKSIIKSINSLLNVFFEYYEGF